MKYSSIMNNPQNSFDGQDEALRRVAYLEIQNRNLPRSLKANFITGRLRTDRVAPTSSANVIPNLDLIYDRVLDANYEYILIDNAGTLEWRRIALSSF